MGEKSTLVDFFSIECRKTLDYIAKNLNGSEFNNLMTTVLASHHGDDDDFLKKGSNFFPSSRVFGTSLESISLVGGNSS